MSGVRPADEDRLPWLEPYREAMARDRRIGRRTHGGLVAVVAALLLIPLAIAFGFWLGQRGISPLRPSPSATVVLPPPKPAAPKIAEAPSVPPVDQSATASQPQLAPAEVPPARVAAPKPVAKKSASKKRSPARRKIRSAGTATPKLDAVRSAQQRQALGRPWPKMPSPGPAGQVIQLGAFRTPAGASNAYATRTARYPLLARMPRVIVPVVTKPDGRILYVLRLGTTSRQQSRTVCRNLRRSGDHCLVIG